MRSWLLSLLLVGVGCADRANEDALDPSGGGKADGWSTAGYVSAASVAAIRDGDDPAAALALARPKLAITFPGDQIEAWEYLKPLGTLGPLGPLGPYGPLGRSGPVGFRVTNPSTSIEIVGAAIEQYAAWLEAVARWYDQLAVYGDLSWTVWKARIDTLVAQLQAWRFESKILSAEGPLASSGPLNPERWTGRVFMDELGLTSAPPTDLIAHMGPGGVLAPVGPVGPLGTLGPLGPLGPTTPLITFQGYHPDAEGRYLPGLNGCFRPAHALERTTNVCRTILVPWKPQAAECTQETTNCRRYEMYENYTEAFAKSFADNDTSFMVGGTAAEGDEDAFAFTSHETQFVTIAVVPEEKPLWDATALQGLMIAAGYVPGNPLFTRAMKYMPEALETYPGAWAAFYDHQTAFDDFDLSVEIRDRDDRVIGTATSDTGEKYGMPEWIQITVSAGARLHTKVSLYARRRGIPGNPEAFVSRDARYRLFVTGATKRAPATATSGPQFVTLVR